MTPISKEAILSLPYEYFRGLDGKPEAICIDMEDFNKLPDKVDVVEVVRCKDCKYKYRHNCTRAVEVWINDEDFCSWGERK